MSRFRYRHLTAVSDPEAIAALKDDFRRQAVRRSDYVSAGARAEHEAPAQVLADESEGSLEELTRMLQEGELMPSDLVFSSGSWTTFEQSAEFFEACEGQVDTRAQWGNAKNIIRFVVGLVLAAIVIAMLLAGCTTGTGRNAYRQKSEAIGTSLRALDHSYGIVARHVELPVRDDRPAGVTPRWTLLELSAEGAWTDDQGMESSSEAIAALSGALES